MDPSGFSQYLVSRETTERMFEVHGLHVSLDPYTQASIMDALRATQQKWVPDLLEKNKISVVFDETVKVSHGGDSAGAAFALATLSTAKNIDPQADIAVTGAIRAYGDISPVGGIYAKTTAAVRHGFKVLLLPEKNTPDVNVMDFDKLGPLQVINLALYCISLRHK